MPMRARTRCVHGADQPGAVSCRPRPRTACPSAASAARGRRLGPRSPAGGAACCGARGAQTPHPARRLAARPERGAERRAPVAEEPVRHRRCTVAGSHGGSLACQAAGPGSDGWRARREDQAPRDRPASRDSPDRAGAAKAELAAFFNSAYCEDLKEQICEVGRRLWQRAYVDGNGGNIAIRAGEDIAICTPTLVSKGFMKPEIGRAHV